MTKLWTTLVKRKSGSESSNVAIAWCASHSPLPGKHKLNQKLPTLPPKTLRNTGVLFSSFEIITVKFGGIKVRLIKLGHGPDLIHIYSKIIFFFQIV